MVFQQFFFTTGYNLTISKGWFGFPSGLVITHLPMRETWDGGSNPAERAPRGGRGTTLVFLPRESHGQRSLAGYNP